MMGLERYPRCFERREWGTNNWDEIQEKIREQNWRDAQEQMTGMPEEQAEWEGWDDPSVVETDLLQGNNSDQHR